MDFEKGIVNKGNLYRLRKLMKAAEHGKPLTIGFIGGSITQGAIASSYDSCYAYRVYKWWDRSFPKSDFKYVNAGIGGTTSQFGAARVEADLLGYEPDFVVIEFSVNDEPNEHYMETFEGLVRKIYMSKKEPAVLVVNNVFYNDGSNAQQEHNQIAKHYGIPCISMQSTIYQEVNAGRITKRDITSDDLHPNDLGHELVASVITYFLDTVKNNCDNVVVEKTDSKAVLPITANAYENSVRYDNRNIKAQMYGFQEDKTSQNGITDCFKNGYFASKPGSKIVFEVEGSGISVQFRKSVKKPAGVAKVIVDDAEEKTVILDGNFDEDWGDKLELVTLTEHEVVKKHKVCIEIADKEEAEIPFYLVSVIAAL